MLSAPLFSGSGVLVRFILRRDRLRLSLWFCGLIPFAVGFAPFFEQMLSTSGESLLMAQMMQNPAMVAMVGPVYGAGQYHIGAAYANMMFLFSAMLAGTMHIFLLLRHTRQDEEEGRLEMIRSLPVGRLSTLASALLVSALSSLALWAAAGLLLYALRQEGMTFEGAMLFGAGMGVTGLVFGGLTAVFCQLTANTRTASSLCFLSMFVLYMMRAAGDVGAEWLSRISPLGLVLRTQVFVENLWWPIGILLGAYAALAVLALALARMRDLGRGIVAERPGRRHASPVLSGPFGLALRLVRTAALIWILVVFVFAGMYGSVFGDLEGFIEGNDMMRAIFSVVSGFSLTDQFIALLMAIISMISALPGMMFVSRVAGEEKSGCAEHVIGKAVSRPRQMAAYFAPALLLGAVLQLAAALGFWWVGSMALDTAPVFSVFVRSALSYLPAIWVMMGVSMVCVAFAPGLTFLPYLYLGYGFLSMYLGQIAGFPRWMQKLTPFGHVPKYPVEQMRGLPLGIMAGLFLGMAAAAFWGYRRRDMRFG